VRVSSILHKLDKFKSVDKYEAFNEILPTVVYSSPFDKEVVSEILNNCCSLLIAEFEISSRPSKPMLKKMLICCMDELTVAPIDAENREFGYQLGWYLAEKVNVDLQKGTERKVWGYWRVEEEEVKIPVRPRFTGRAKPKVKEEAVDEETATKLE
jgi:hypothetical protein